jgi:SAM-dependent methyltransferase
MSAMTVHPTNAEQARAWDGDEGAHWAVNADAYERSTERYDDALLTAARVGETSHVLDIGCGTGSTSRAAARRASRGSVFGVDLSARMIDVARARTAATGLANVRFQQADGQTHDFEDAEFDCAISRTTAMFFGDPVAAFANIRRALTPGGLVAAVVWGDPARNEWFREIFTALSGGRDLPAPPRGAPGPFALADPNHAREVLTAAGYFDIAIEERDEPMWFGADADSAVALLTGQLGWLLEGLDDDGRHRAVEALRATAAEHVDAGGVQFASSALLLTARA